MALSRALQAVISTAGAQLLVPLFNRIHIDGGAESRLNGKNRSGGWKLRRRARLQREWTSKIAGIVG